MKTSSEGEKLYIQRIYLLIMDMFLTLSLNPFKHSTILTITIAIGKSLKCECDRDHAQSVRGIMGNQDE